MSLLRLVLFGRASRPVSALELDVFLEDSRDHAARHDVTGSLMLVHSGERPTAFVQWIEGSPPAVHALDNVFANQPFVEDKRVLVRVSPLSRVYPTWGVTRRHSTAAEIETALKRFSPVA